MQVLLLVSAISLFAMLIEDSAALSQIEFWLSVDWKKFEPPPVVAVRCSFNRLSGNAWARVMHREISCDLC